MATLVWHASLQIGHPRLDAEHEQLIGLAGTVEDLVAGHGSLESIRRACDEFLHLLKSHCMYEETLFRKLPLSYAHLVDEHVFDHLYLIENVNSLAMRLCSGERGNDDLADFGKTMTGLMRDLLVDDVELIRCLVREGKLELGPHMNLGGTQLNVPGSAAVQVNG